MGAVVQRRSPARSLRSSLLVLGTTLAVGVTGCGAGDAPASAESTPPPPASTGGTPAGGAARPSSGPATPRPATPTPAALLDAPRSGACYQLTVAAAGRPVNRADPVSCRRQHTAVTIAIGTVDPLRDGHLLALDSLSVQEETARTCDVRLARHVGGSLEDRRLSRVQSIWFSPTLRQGDRGALWFRCDLVALAGPGRLAELPRRTAGMLDRPALRDAFATCGTAAPSDKRFAKVTCDRRHTWRARATIGLPRGARYLAKSATAAADSRCRDIDARLAANSLKLRWSFEWPTRAQWQAGQRYGYCWTPDPA